jgi:hypothetical protein
VPANPNRIAAAHGDLSRFSVEYADVTVPISGGGRRSERPRHAGLPG